ncbi:MAG: acyl dehydratase [Rhodobacteraceae bacterium]|nr:acyl dehydratase [Paracoccaceae bacterium]
MQDVLRTTGFYFEEIEVGAKFTTRTRTVTEADLVGFCNLTWMTESLFTDREHIEEGAGADGRVIPGVMVYAMAEGLLTYTMERTGMAFLHADFTVKGPTYVGDSISVEVEIIEARPTSKPGRGLVRSRNRVLKADGTECIVYEPLRMLRAKSGN